MSDIFASRKERRILEADNRSRPQRLERMPKNEWTHLNRSADRRIECWRSQKFLVQVFAERDNIERLTISRTSIKGDRWADEISWDDLQRLKSECGRGGRDAVEIYPTEADVVNVANMRHLWVLPNELTFKWKATRPA